jgi:hypothetical protein
VRFASKRNRPGRVKGLVLASRPRWPCRPTRFLLAASGAVGFVDTGPAASGRVNSAAWGILSRNAFLATQFPSCFLPWGCGCRLGDELSRHVSGPWSVIGCSTLVAGYCWAERFAGASRLNVLFGFLDWGARRGGPIKAVQKSFRFPPVVARLSLCFSMFCDEIGWKNGGDFWISGRARPGPKVQKLIGSSFRRARQT